MSPHDALASQALQFKKSLEQYMEKFEPKFGDVAHKLATQLVMYIDSFVEDEE